MVNIYDRVKSEIENIEKNLEVTDDFNTSENKAKTEALKQIQEFRQNSFEKLKKLQSNQDWEKFCIAFYGETNAGKSTLIEALRLYLNEKNKIKEHGNLVHQQNEIKKEIKEFKNNIRNLSIFEKITNFFKGKNAKIELCNFLKAMKQKRLELPFDGTIIGDGRSDFTRKSTKYDFTHNGKEFIIMDLPGIEGKESDVIDEILSSTQKAHIVFYIKNEPRPPQKGDEKTIGTIEKIKSHLDDMTDVYAIYNKSITNTRILKREFLNDSEIAGLKELDEKMGEILGKHYKGHFTISAQPAFYANAKYLQPNSKFKNDSNKFLKEFSKDEILQKTLFIEFVNFIKNNLIPNSEKKIKQANLYKIQMVLDNGINMLMELLNAMFIPLRDKFKSELVNVNSKLDKTVDITEDDIRRELKDTIYSYLVDARNKLYKFVDSDISNDELKNRIDDEIENVNKKMESEYKKIIDKNIISMNNEIKRIIKNLERRAKSIIENINSQINLNKTSNEIDTKSGFDTLKFIGALTSIGSGIAILLSGGWVVAGLVGIAVGVVAFLKSIWSFFSDKYKKAQQKKSIDENLRKYENEAYSSIDKDLNTIFENIKNEVKKIKNQLDMEVVASFEKLCDILSNSINEIKQISFNIKQEAKI